MTRRHSIVLLLAACHSSSPAPSAAPADASHAAAPVEPSGVDVAGMDRAVAPGDDFFAYANGAWLATHEIPPDRGSYGTGAILDELTTKRTAELITDKANADA